MLRKIIILVVLFCQIAVAEIKAQQYAPPLQIPMFLSGNFAECRSNHFHSGLDIKTNGRINIPVYTIEEGYIARISVSPTGYGLALYVAHPDGRTSVYGHLNTFAPDIQQYVEQEQYRQEQFRVNIFPERNRFPLKKGQLIAYSGNTGSSGGPHLHFEIRDTKTQDIINPLPFYKSHFKDTIPPRIQSLLIYPVSTEATVNSKQTSLRVNVDGRTTPQKVSAWGDIGISLKTHDRMNSTHNKYGIASIRLLVDGTQVFYYANNRYSFHQGRMFNSVIDFATWKQQKEFFLRSYLLPGNNFSFYRANNRGIISINQERAYRLKYEVTDLYNNTSYHEFIIYGKETVKSPQESNKEGLHFAWNKNNHMRNASFSIAIPQGNLYEDVFFQHQSDSSSQFYSDIHTINTYPVPLHKYCPIRIKITSDSLKNKSQYGIVKIAGGQKQWIGGSYQNGWIQASIRELGDKYAVFCDTKPPVIQPISPSQWKKRGYIRVRISDNLSGIKNMRATINGKFALFSNDMKSPIYQYKINPGRIGKNRTHTLHILAEDACGNSTEYTTTFTY